MDNSTQEVTTAAISGKLSCSASASTIWDIGLYVELKQRLDDDTKANLLENTWTPDSSYKFTFQYIGGKNRKFQPSWLVRFSWLAFSDALQGAFCKICVLFLTDSDVAAGKGSHQCLGYLISMAFKNWKHAIETFGAHANSNYHKNAAVSASNFLHVYRNKKSNICSQLKSKNEEESKRNREILTKIIQAIKLCGRQELSLRGHKDSGKLSMDEPDHNDGNFRALLRYSINCGDDILKEHIMSAGRNALYLSPTIQNEIIQIIGQNIQLQVIKKIQHVKFFAVLADETTDISRIEQFSVCVRFVDENCILREDFLGFVPVYDVTGEGLATTIKTQLRNLGLDLCHMRGQGYDGAGAMKGCFNGVQARIRQEYPKAVYTHCVSHTLNLCLVDSAKVSSIRNAFGVIKECCVFFRSSARWSATLKNNLQMSGNSSLSLKKYCETRWVERHESVSIFCEAISEVVSSLEEIIEENRDDSSKAEQLHSALCKFSFLVAMCISDRMLGLTYILSQYLQGTHVDLAIALEKIELVVKKFKKMRQEAEEEFKVIFERASDLALSFGQSPLLPRIVGTQRHRSNIPATTPEEYFRRTVFIPFLDEMISSLHERFSKHKEILVGLQCLIPRSIIKSKFSDLKPAIEFYSNDLVNSNASILEGEWDVWKMKWIESETLPRYAVEALLNCEKAVFPNMHILLVILATLPVSTASVERTFSTLKRIKTYLRNSTGQERLNGLALMSVHREITVSDEEIINIFSKNNRHLIL